MIKSHKSILERNNVVGHKLNITGPITPLSLKSAKLKYPYKTKKPKDLIDFLFLVNQDRIASPPYNSILGLNTKYQLEKDCLYLMTIYRSSKIIDAIIKASETISYPFGFVYVQKILEEKK